MDLKGFDNNFKNIDLLYDFFGFMFFFQSFSTDSLSTHLFKVDTKSLIFVHPDQPKNAKSWNLRFLTLHFKETLQRGKACKPH